MVEGIISSNQMAPPMQQPTGDCFPYVANHTLSDAAERAGRYPDPITALAFDPAQELLYAGTSDGRLTVFHSPSLQRHAACGAHPTAVGNDASTHTGDPSVLDIAPFGSPGGGGGGVVSVSSTRVACHSTGAVKRWSHDLGLKDPRTPSTGYTARPGGTPSSYAHQRGTTARRQGGHADHGDRRPHGRYNGRGCGRRELSRGHAVMAGHAPRGRSSAEASPASCA